MENITLKFTACHPFNILSRQTVVLTMDESGKHYSIEFDNMLAQLKADMDGEEFEQPELPKRVVTAFTENAIKKILSKDEIPNVSGMMVLDGFSYEITISKGDLTKEYFADDASIETYPLLRYLASWCRKQ